MKKLPIIIALILISSLIFSGIVFAQNNDPGNPAYIQDDADDSDNNGKKPDLDEKKESQLEFKCKTSSSKMDKLEAKYRNNFDKHQETYMNMIGRINEVLDELENKGYDTTEARDAAEGFKTKVMNAEQSFSNFSYEFQQARDQLCEDNVTGYRQSLNQSRNQLKELRNVMLQLRLDYNEEVKPELIQLKQDVQQENVDDSETEEQPTNDQLPE